MRFSCLTGVAPGRTLAEQCAAIAAAGCTGVETIIFPHTSLEAWVQELSQAASAANLTPAVVILGGLALYQPGQMGWIAEALAAIAEVGAAALVTPEYRAQNPLPLLPPFPAPSPAEWVHMMAAVEDIARMCAQRGVPLYLEPLTQFEGRFWRTIDATVAVCNQLEQVAGQVEGGVVVDFHNMNITEADPVAAILLAAGTIKHVHLADNNRRLPGYGHIDIAAGLKALRTIGYDGWYSFECAVDGEFTAALHGCMAWLRKLVHVGASKPMVACHVLRATWRDGTRSTQHEHHRSI